MVPTDIPEVVIIEPTVFSDDRGWFMESFNEKGFMEGLKGLNLPAPEAFVQDNHSCSKKGVLRGLHYQASPFEQGKLVRVVQGAAFDVAVDIRPDSATYLKWVGVELSSNNRKMLWIPEGFAHGFLALDDDTLLLYKTTDYYQPGAERSLRWDDVAFKIDWPVVGQMIISPKDEAAPEYCQK